MVEESGSALPGSGGAILNISISNEYNDQNENRQNGYERSKEPRASSHSLPKISHTLAKHVKWDQNDTEQPHQGDLVNSTPDLRPKDAYDPASQESSTSSKTPVKSHKNMALSITIEHSNS